MNKPNIPDAERLVDTPTVAATLGVDPKHPYTLAGKDGFPLPIQVGGLTRWRWSEIQAYIDSRPRGFRAGRRGGPK